MLQLLPTRSFAQQLVSENSFNLVLILHTLAVLEFFERCLAKGINGAQAMSRHFDARRVSLLHAAARTLLGDSGVIAPMTCDAALRGSQYSVCSTTERLACAFRQQLDFFVTVKMRWTARGWIYVLAVVVICWSRGCEGNKEARRLYDDIFSKYNKLIRPVRNLSEPVQVSMGLRLSQLIEVVSLGEEMVWDLPFLAQLFPQGRMMRFVSSIIFLYLKKSPFVSHHH